VPRLYAAFGFQLSAFSCQLQKSLPGPPSR
jgi:hypothetical protein